ncbi:MAG TPA: FAD-dependent oxidoreductase [Dokdonella sp.]|uniref:NAD(P)/FAD-dependent oxidoreductase n=1 Tax=Dokdonella sp. TaxID=2291710 RepID=UPI002D8035A1|nr:FAD-dependent oxidoreductase [Dokdonella sp.]HET9034344.1 FAD-dependent oxidoreductase [Dokdonella sp.]
MRIAVIGSGIAGLGSAWLLSRQHDVVLFEKNERLGGHTDTHDIEVGGRNHAVDSGFIVFNHQHYPLLTRMFAELGVDSQATTMSFSAHNAGTGLEYNAGSLGGLFCQRRNLLSPRFWRMLADLRRFYRESPALLSAAEAGPTLGEYLQQNHYSDAFRDDHLVPMASALWSSPSRRILDFPAIELIRFMANHDMLQISGRPQWRVVSGGSQRYIDALRKQWSVDERLDCAATSIRRHDEQISVRSAAGVESFDQLVLACHADDALALLDDASENERAILGDLGYQDNDTVLHTDASILPGNRRAWAAWNAYIPADRDAACSVSYWMNALQSIESSEPLIVSLNRTDQIDPAKILRRRSYRHPVQTQASASARRRKSEIQGRSNTWFAGAYWGFGFHEDGLRSAFEVAKALGVEWS